MMGVRPAGIWWGLNVFATGMRAGSANKPDECDSNRAKVSTHAILSLALRSW